MGDARDREDELSDFDVVENDNLDRESLFSEDLMDPQSPVDGYFEARDHPQDTFLQNLSVQAESEAKAREAAQEQPPRVTPTASSTGRSAHANYQHPSVESSGSQPSHSSPTWQPTSTPQEDVGPPPPDYLTAISDSGSSGRASQGVPSPPQSHASFNQGNYGTMNAGTGNLPWPLGGQGNPFAGGEDSAWPFGNRGNPFAGGEDSAWPFGRRNPFVNPNFPFNAGGNSWNLQGARTYSQTQGNVTTNHVQTGSQQSASQMPHESSNDFSNTQDPYTEERSQASFDRDHPLVRNGLFSDSGAPQTQSMSDRPPEQSPVTGSRRAPAEFDDGEFFDEESALIALEGPRDLRSGRGIWRRSHRDSHKSRGWRSRLDKGRHCVSFFCYRACWILGFVILALLIGIVVLTRIAGSNSGNDAHANPGVHDPSTEPSTGEPIIPPAFASPENNGFCQWGEQHRLLVTRSTPDRLTLIESMERPRSGGPRQISGEMKVSAGDSDQKEDVKISMYMQASKGWKVDKINYEEIGGSINIKYPDLTQVSGSRWLDCLWLTVHIQVRPDLKIKDLEINTAHLSVSSDKRLFGSEKGFERRAQGLVIQDSAIVSTTAGSIYLPYWNSRETYIRSNAGQVTGRYALLDLLSIKTSSGGVDVEVALKEVDSNNPQPAELQIASDAGSVDARMPTWGYIPKRDYKANVVTASGSIGGSYLFESSATFKSSAGSIRVDVAPYTSDAHSLRTSTTSSSTHLQLLAPITATSDGDSSDISNLKSSHEAAAGSVRIDYPQEWTGDVHAKSTIGSIKLRGKDLESTVRKSPGEKTGTGRKGNGNSHVFLTSQAGSIDLLVGDGY